MYTTIVVSTVSQNNVHETDAVSRKNRSGTRPKK